MNVFSIVQGDVDMKIYFNDDFQDSDLLHELLEGAGRLNGVKITFVYSEIFFSKITPATERRKYGETGFLIGYP